MSNVKILLLEDDILSAESLKCMLEDAGYQVVGVTASGDRAIELFQATDPDLIILDIRVKGAIDGVEVGRRINAIRPVPVIFLTAYAEEFYEQAKIVHPAAFFSKPYNERDLVNAIDLALHNFMNDNKDDSIDKKVVTQLPNIYFAPDCIWIKSKSGHPFFRLAISDILWIKAENVYVDIYTTHRDAPFTLTLGLSDFVKHSAYEDLVQIHRSYIVNVQQVTGFSTTKIIIQDGQEIPVSKSHQEKTMQALLHRSISSVAGTEISN